MADIIQIKLSFPKNVSPRPKQRKFISYANAKRAKRCYRGRIWNAERLLVYAKILRLWMKTSWIPASFFIVLRSSADLIIFEFLTVIIYFATLKKYGFTKSLMQFLTDTSKSFVKTLMVKLRLTDHTSEPYFTKISQSSLVGIIYYKLVRQEEKDSGLQQFSKIHRPSAGW